jgi:hypothetical protein
MRLRFGSLRFGAALLFFLFAIGQVHAQATRTWISGVGDDANPCSRTAPCKTFAGAISKTATGGVIDILDPGGFGALTITKSITVENVGEVGSILVAGTAGINVNGAGAVVTLRGLSFEGLGLGGGTVGTVGVHFLQGSQLLIEHCDIGGFMDSNSGIGVDFGPGTAASLVVRDSTIHNNGNVSSAVPGGGIRIKPSGTGSVTAMFDNVRFVNNNGFGLQVNGSASVTVRNSVVSGNIGNGIWGLAGSTGAIGMTLENVTISDNTQVGALAQGAATQLRLSKSVITGNAQGVQSVGGGEVISFGDNRNYGNVFDGVPDAKAALQ